MSSKKKVYKKQKISLDTRIKVWNKYIEKNKGTGECWVGCGTIISQFNFHCGHIKAEFKSGPTTIANLRPICSKCNKSMGTQNMNTFIKKFEFKILNNQLNNGKRKNVKCNLPIAVKMAVWNKHVGSNIGNTSCFVLGCKTIITPLKFKCGYAKYAGHKIIPNLLPICENCYEVNINKAIYEVYAQNTENSIKFAIQNHYLHLLKYCCQYSKKKSTLPNWNWALMCATETGDLEIVKICENQGATNWNSSLCSAASHGYLKILKYCKKIITHNDCEEKIDWNLILEIATEFCHLKIIEYCQKQLQKQFKNENQLIHLKNAICEFNELYNLNAVLCVSLNQDDTWQIILLKPVNKIIIVKFIDNFSKIEFSLHTNDNIVLCSNIKDDITQIITKLIKINLNEKYILDTPNEKHIDILNQTLNYLLGNKCEISMIVCEKLLLNDEPIRKIYEYFYSDLSNDELDTKIQNDWNDFDENKKNSLIQLMFP